jgi:hypothetical protein
MWNQQTLSKSIRPLPELKIKLLRRRPPPPPLAILQQTTITKMPEFKLCRKIRNHRLLRTSQMTELQAKFQAEAAEFKALQKELQKVFLRLLIFFADSRPISSAFFLSKRNQSPFHCPINHLSGDRRVPAATISMQRERGAHPPSSASSSLTLVVPCSLLLRNSRSCQTMLK